MFEYNKIKKKHLESKIFSYSVNFTVIFFWIKYVFNPQF